MTATVIWLRTYVRTPDTREQALRRGAAALDNIEYDAAPIGGQAYDCGRTAWALTPAEQEALVRMMIAAAVSIGWPRQEAERTIRTAYRAGMDDPEDLSALTPNPKGARHERRA